MRNGSLAALRVPAHGGFRNSSGVALAVHGRSEFDTDADVDIATMAAQRDQLRGARNVRGMMAPVMSKEVSKYRDSLHVPPIMILPRSNLD